jgi:nucleoside-diphosphate-sugar epimerase
MAEPLSLVTGSCGFIGTHMVEVLHEAGHKIRATDLASAYERDDKKTGRFPSVLKKLGVDFIPSDMTKRHTLKRLVKGVDYVFHIASVFSYSAPWKTLESVNVHGTRNLCELLVKEKSLERLVLWGAGGVYGFPREGMLPITEDMAPDPPNDYLKSKWTQEFLVMEYGKRRGLPYSIIRPTTVYGPRAVYGGGQLLMTAAGMKLASAPANFTARIPFIHVKDVCKAALFLTEKPEAEGEIYNVNDDSRMTNLEYFEFVAKEMGNHFIKTPPVPIEPLRLLLTGVATAIKLFSDYVTPLSVPLEADSVQYLGRDFIFSNEKLKALGYKFVYPDARDGIRDTLHWYKENGWI